MNESRHRCNTTQYNDTFISVTRLIHMCDVTTWARSSFYSCHVTRINESRHTYKCVKSHMWMRHVECEWVTLHTWMYPVTHMNKSCHTYEWVMSHIWMSHVTHMSESCHTWMSHVTHMSVSLHTDKSVILCTKRWMSHVTHADASCHISEMIHAIYEWVMSHAWTSCIWIVARDIPTRSSIIMMYVHT